MRLELTIVIKYPKAFSTMIVGANSLGHVVGYALIHPDDPAPVPFIWRLGVFQRVQLPLGAGVLGIAENSDYLLGAYGTTTSLVKGFVFNPNTGKFVLTYAVLGASNTQFVSFNRHGVLCGNYEILDQYGKARDYGFCLFHPFTSPPSGFSKIVYPGAAHTTIRGVNAYGDTAGAYSIGSVDVHWFVRHQGVFQTFDIASSATIDAISVSSPSVVGYYFNSNLQQVGFIRYWNGAVTTYKYPRADQTDLVARVIVYGFTVVCGNAGGGTVGPGIGFCYLTP